MGCGIVVAMNNWDFDDRGDELDGSSWDDRPIVALSLLPAQQAELAEAIAAGLRDRGCDNTLRSAREWATREGVEWAALQVQLESRGGFCDCEVLLNAVPATGSEPD